MFLIMLDTTGKRPAETILRGVERYREKFGREPALCLVSPREPDIPDAPVLVRRHRGVVRHHYFIGDWEGEGGDA